MINDNSFTIFNSLFLATDSNRLHTGFRQCNSVENIIDKDRTEDDRQFLEKYRQMDISGSEEARDSNQRRRYSMVMLPTAVQPNTEKKFSPSDNNIILSKTVRKEKRKQREKRERSVERIDDSTGW